VISRSTCKRLRYRQVRSPLMKFSSPRSRSEITTLEVAVIGNRGVATNRTVGCRRA
jgi:hypothetical protein